MDVARVKTRLVIKLDSLERVIFNRDDIEQYFYDETDNSIRIHFKNGRKQTFISPSDVYFEKVYIQEIYDLND